MSAQNPACAMACSANVNVEMDADCAITMVPDQVLMGTPPCPGTYLLFLVTPAGDTLTNNTITAQNVGQNLMATVYHVDSQNKCMGTVHVSDQLPPVLTCPPVTIACTQSTSPTALPMPMVADNCTPGVVPEFVNDQIMMDGACTDSYVKKIMRLWRATDASGRTGFCLQEITQTRPTFADVMFPAPRDTIAVGTVADPAVTGQPTIAGLPIDLVACDMFANQNDFDTIVLCRQNGLPVEKLILREWLVVDQCLNQLVRDTQYIYVKDMTPPTLVCPPNTTVSTIVDECFANIASLPFPQVSVPDSVAVSWQFGNSFGPYDSIPPGVYDLIYRAFDCSHVRSCTTKLTIKDTQTPSAVLIGNRVVSLSSGGVSVMPASVFDQGSNDNCDNVFLTVSRDGVNFANFVSFDCNDVGSQVMVSVQVCEVNNPNNCTLGMVGITIQDKLAPALIFAPQNLTVDCLYDYTNPTVGGNNTPIFEDNCGIDTVEFDLVNNVNGCGNGTVRRIWTAYDVHGNSSKFTQVVTVQNTHPLTQADITWPANYQTSVCGASLALADIPVPFREPVVHDPGCSQIAVSHVDQVFNIGGPACNKVMRKWTVVDWCQYDPNNPNAGGRWQYTQVLQVMDGVAPTLSVPGDLTVSVGSNCIDAAVALPNATGTDCSTMLTITHNSAHATAPGVNASGDYPIGTHLITYRAADGCGNITQKTSKITVVDNVAPSALCMNGLSANLSTMVGGTMVMLSADVFNAGSSDYCTPANQLKLNVKKQGSPDAPTPSLTFDCDEKGLQLVELHVTDAKGNTGLCVTYVLIQDNLDLCPDPGPQSKATVAGEVETETGQKVLGVTMSVPNFPNAIPVATDATGAFAIPNLPLFGNYEIRPEKDGDDLNGVSTYDLALLNRHILGVSPLASPYKMIAADVNKSGSITSFDIVELRRTLLGITPELPNNHSWRFVDKNFVFSNPQNPFVGPFPETKAIQNLSADSVARFIGIKVGDLNGNASPGNFDDSADDRTEMPEFELIADDQTYNEGDAFAFSLKAANRQEITALAFTIEFDPEKIAFEDWAPGVLPNVSEGNLNLLGIGEGRVSFCWGEAGSVETAPKQTMLMFQGRAKQNTNLSEAIRLHYRPTRTEAFGPDGEEMNVTLHFTRPDGSVVPAASAYELYQNQPNPFTGETTIGLHLPADKAVSLSVFDAAGRLVLEQKRNFEKGYNEFVIWAKDLPSRGVFSYRVQTDDWTASRKMVRN